MKKFLILIFVCLLVFSGCAKEDVDAEKEQEKVEVEKPPKVEKEPAVEEEPVVEEVPNFGLTDAEVEWIDNYLSTRFKVRFEDLVKVDRIPNENAPPMAVEMKHYALWLKDGLMIQICIPVEELEN